MCQVGNVSVGKRKFMYEKVVLCTVLSGRGKEVDPSKSSVKFHVKFTV